jgi:superfamily II DNA or RNA helicase
LTEEEIGIWRADDGFGPQHKLVIGLVQSVMKGPERYPTLRFEDFGLVVCDEVHRMGAEHFSQAMWWLPAKLRLGLSATPVRKDGKDIVFLGHIGPVKVVAEQETLIPSIFVRKTSWKVPLVTRYGRYTKLPHSMGRTTHLAKLMAFDHNRNAMILEFVKAACDKGRATLIFSDIIDHLKELEVGLLTLGVPKEAIGYYVGLNTGNHIYSGSQLERKKQREAAKIKSVILATYQMASEATDIPWIDTCVLGTPKADVVQIVGRIRREYPDKKTPLVLDLVDSDSEVFRLYAEKRARWYASLGAKVTLIS